MSDQSPIVPVAFPKAKRGYLVAVPGHAGVYRYPNEPTVFYIRPVVDGRQIRHKLLARTPKFAARERKRLLNELALYQAGIGRNPFDQAKRPISAAPDAAV